MTDMCDITASELYSHAERLCQLHWQEPFSGCTIEITNTKWKSCFGKFNHNKDRSKPPKIRFSRPMNATRSKEQVLATLLHELVHLRMYKLGLPCKDTDDEFIAECLRIGAKISRKSNAQKAYMDYLSRSERPHTSLRERETAYGTG